MELTRPLGFSEMGQRCKYSDKRPFISGDTDSPPLFFFHFVWGLPLLVWNGTGIVVPLH